MFYFNLYVFYMLNAVLSIYGINHWILDNENGKILQKIDSPFFLREPNNLIAFLDQVTHNEIIENTFLQLSKEKKRMVEQINHSIDFGMELIEQSKCAMDFYRIENAITYTKITKEYLKRISIKRKKSLKITKNTIPLCSNYIPLKSGICCYDHLESIRNTDTIRIQPETELLDSELEFNTNEFLINLLNGLEDSPGSWKYHVMGSYYWRMKGDAFEAIECAKRAVMLAPRRHKDIPLLSLGIILWRAEKFKDAEILFSAAVDHAPEISENQFALGSVLAMTYKYNRSMEHFELARKIKPDIFGPKLRKIKSVLTCIDSLNKKTSTMYKNVELIKEEVNGLKDLKNVLTSSHDKLMQQQVPLGARYISAENLNINKLLNRGQYCSPRTLTNSEKPVLICDFYSDLQIRLESKELDIESLEQQINKNSDVIIKKLETDLKNTLDENNKRKE